MSGSSPPFSLLFHPRMVHMDGNDKPEKQTVPGVAIDGNRVRSIRETKRLTQLYVANVVGVTTDTISRWENNRYPSIKKENAQKLAEALEVPLEEILRQEEATTAEPPSPTLPPSSRGPWRKTGLVAVMVGLSALALILVLYRSHAPDPAATRWVPRFAAPGEVLPVQIKVSRQTSDAFAFILKERLPAALQFVNSSPPRSAAQSSATDIKWLVPAGAARVTISYTVRVPVTQPQGKVEFRKGEIVQYRGDENRAEGVAGGGEIRIGAYHWADSNGDGRIDDDEIMPAYYICEEMKGLGLDWAMIEEIWSGKGYTWDARNGYTVLE